MKRTKRSSPSAHFAMVVMISGFAIYGCAKTATTETSSEAIRSNPVSAVIKTGPETPSSSTRSAVAKFRANSTTLLSVDYQPNDCNELLKDGVFDQRDVFGTSFEAVSVLNRFCGAKYATFSAAASDSANLGIPVEDLMAAFGYNDASTNFSAEYSQLCSQKDIHTLSDNSLTVKVKTADSALANAFVECTKNADTHWLAYLLPADTKQFQIIAKYVPIGDEKAKDTNLDYDRTLISCSPAPKSIGPQGVVINCHRKTDSTVSILSLWTTEGSQAFKMPAYIPPAPVPPCVARAISVTAYVPATAGWVDTRTNVPAGVNVHLVADPTTTWTISSSAYGNYAFVGSCGYNPEPAPAMNPADRHLLPMPEAAVGALVARRGPSGEVALVCNAADLGSSVDGDVFLTINDAAGTMPPTAGLRDNAGTMGVTLTYTQACP